MSFTSLLKDRMDIFRPTPQVESEAGSDAAPFAHLKEDFEGEGVCEVPEAVSQKCRLHEKTETVLVDGKQITVVKSEVFCGPSVNVRNRDRLKVTPRGRTERTFDAEYVKQVPGRRGPHHLEITVKEVA